MNHAQAEKVLTLLLEILTELRNFRHAQRRAVTTEEIIRMCQDELRRIYGAPPGK